MYSRWLRPVHTRRPENSKMIAQIFKTLETKAADGTNFYSLEVDSENTWMPVRITMKWGEMTAEMLYEDTAHSCLCQEARMPRTCCGKEDYVYAQECFGIWVCPFVLAPTLDLIITEWEKRYEAQGDQSRTLGQALTLETLQTRRTRPQDIEPHWRAPANFLHPNAVRARHLKREADQDA